ncbi:hypothetical protein KUCAC02_022426 [Chaenocephalus aceratus]|uniref:Uncharacterized protein n=1 Tax=Chaenocephalus aceratus TaxID=36190 RepID=A0ACB9XM22_CHAAC|nr:hypothetical protein KUCAC02_022426 [Chaenocephalus aceratus]
MGSGAASKPNKRLLCLERRPCEDAVSSGRGSAAADGRLNCRSQSGADFFFDETQQRRAKNSKWHSRDVNQKPTRVLSHTRRGLREESLLSENA